MTSSIDFFRASSTPMAVLSSAGIISELNNGWNRVVDDPSTTVKGKVFTALLCAADAERVGKILAEVGREGASFDAAFEAGPGIKTNAAHFDVSRDEAGNALLVVTLIAAERDASDVAKLEEELRAQRAIVDKQNATLGILSRALRSAPLVLWAIDRTGLGIHCEGKGIEGLGLKPTDIIGNNLFDLYKDHPAGLIPVQKALAGEEVRTIIDAPTGALYDSWYMPIRTSSGEIDGCIGLSIEITERVKTEQELREKLEFIETQTATIRALATPIIQVWDDVLCLPVVGTVDSARTADMMETLLSAIVREKARFAIVDLTGVEVVDTSTADHLIQLFRAARVLGVEGVLCGIRPAVAQTVVTLGTDIGGVRTMQSLREALKWCLSMIHSDVNENWSVGNGITSSRGRVTRS
ncbi:MAG TPA: STAS domain-containing protein [Labilithrix sp.]|jgi:rsbT co-antagonist protein RsbR|nr:STAS domain-containing protein [Labilithrix sp.]